GTGWRRLHRDTGLHRRLLEREPEHLVDRHHRMERNLLAHVFGDVLEVGAVSLRDDDVGDACRMRGEHLLLEAADRQYAALEGDLAGHADRVLDGPTGQERRDRRRHRDPSTRTVLRYRARGHVKVEGALLEELLVDPELGSASAHRRERDLRGFLHDVAELAGEDELVAVLVGRRLDE